jgi:ADP-dependent NAD(P)H-hydrate dehydratase / NAD(P)H-hydrate epimerase
MNEALTAAQMRDVERAAIDAGQVTGLELMERAGRRVVEAMLAWWPELASTSHRAAVLCGPGNNGGDGFVIARLLSQHGWDVEVFLYGRDPSDIDALPSDAAVNARRWSRMGEIKVLTPRTMPAAFDICVDAIFGTGLVRDLDADLQEIVAMTEPERSPLFGKLVCVDIATGLCSDSGRPRPAALRGALTVTFHRAKLGHFLAGGPGCCGRLVVADIGLDPAPVAGAIRVNAAPTARKLGKDGAAHKYGHGHALVLSGGVGKAGAARLAARGALRVGAGLVTVGCPPAALIENAAALDAVMLAPVKDAGALRELVEGRRIKAACIGPGFGPGERLRAFVAALLVGGQAAAPAAVLDADAISEFADEPRVLFALLHPRCVLTPHEGEFGRLFPDLLERLRASPGKGAAYSKVDATREAAARAGCVVLFKGPDTVIADPSGRCAIGAAAYQRAAPWLATAGAGDVLAGFIAGLLARGFAAFDAAEAAAWLHVECALKFGPGLISEDLSEALPAVFRELGL